MKVAASRLKQLKAASSGLVLVINTGTDFANMCRLVPPAVPRLSCHVYTHPHLVIQVIFPSVVVSAEFEDLDLFLSAQLVTEAIPNKHTLSISITERVICI